MLRHDSRPGARRSRKGAATVVAVLCLSAFLGVIALAIDGGLWMAERRRAQTAADSAALAAASVLYERFDADQGLDPTGRATAAALEYAAMYDYRNDQPGVTKPVVIVEIPPTSAEGQSNPDSQYEQQFIGKAGYVKVRIESTRKRLFSAVFGGGDLFVARRAVAAGAKGGGAVYSPAAIILLEPSSTGALSLSGSARVEAGGGIQVKSSHRNAISASGASSVVASDIEVVGGTRTSGSASVQPSPRSPSAPIVDPLASIAPPDPTSMTSRGTINLSGSQTATLNPGLYNKISASGSSKINMNPGIYYVQSGGFNISGLSGATGEGVMIYMAGGGSFNISGSGDVKLSAPTSGDYAGLLLFQDRTSNKAVYLSGGSEFVVKGTLYAANAHLNVSGDGAYTQQGVRSQHGSQLIGRTLTPSGSSGVWVSGEPGEMARRSGSSILGLVE